MTAFLIRLGEWCALTGGIAGVSCLALGVRFHYPHQRKGTPS